jgi:Protein of unknown function (DUF1579)
VHAKPQAEHDWLQKLLGSWTYRGEAVMQPGEAPTVWGGSETVRTIGGLWFLCEAQGEVPGGDPTTTLMTLGYDPAKKAYVGTFIGSMMTHLWSYSGGEVNAEGTVLSLYAEGPGMTPEAGTTRYRDSIEFVSDTHRILASSTQGPDGQWIPFMSALYHKVAG